MGESWDTGVNCFVFYALHSPALSDKKLDIVIAGTALGVIYSAISRINNLMMEFPNGPLDNLF